MLDCVVSTSSSNSLTFFSPMHKQLMMRKRIGADITRKISAARLNVASSFSAPRVTVSVDTSSTNASSYISYRAGPKQRTH